MKSVAALLLALTISPSATAQAPTKADANSPDNAGRKQLVDYLNKLAASQTAARRETVARITTQAQAEARQKHVRETILALIGSLPARVPLNPRTTGSTQQDGFRVDKVLFDSQPNFPVTALLYIPDGNPGKFPAVVMAPGHSPAGKAGDVAFASAFARAGFVVLSYDPIGQGERLQYLDPKSPVDKPVSLATRPTGEHAEAALQPTLLGDAVARYFLWDGMRAVDYLASLPQVDPKRIGAFGCSGGGAMTALLGALDTRIAATGTACYTTSYDTLLPSIGPQDAEQSIPNFIVSGLDFPDWVEVAGPRPYAIIATTSDMFPFAGAKSTEAEARRFYGLLGADKNLAFITGPGGHGNLRPILPQILRFFADHLHPDAAYASGLPPITDPFDEKANPSRKPGERPVFPPPPPVSLTQVTATGQLGSSYSGVATVFSLNKTRAGTLHMPHPSDLAGLQRAVRLVTHASAIPGDAPSREGEPLPAPESGKTLRQRRFRLSLADGFTTVANYLPADGEGQHTAVLYLTEVEDPFGSEAVRQLAKGGAAVLAITPRPSPPGTEETKSPILGPYYMTQLRSELVGKTLLGMRVDDVIHAVDFLLAQPHVRRDQVSIYAAGHLGLVAVHAAVLDARVKKVVIRGSLASYRGLLDTPLPIDAPEDILPGVVRHYDLPDLYRALGPRLTADFPRSGGELDKPALEF